MSSIELLVMKEHNQQLLQVKTLLLCAADENNKNPGTALSKALERAEEAVKFAGTYNQPNLHARAQLFRGHALRAMGRWYDAHQAYVRAASVCPSIDKLTQQMMANVEDGWTPNEVTLQRERQTALRVDEAYYDSVFAGGPTKSRELFAVMPSYGEMSTSSEACQPSRLRRMKGMYFRLDPKFWLEI